MKNIVLVGGGVTNCLLSILLKKHYRDSVDVFIVEKNDTLLKKLTITGNGKCNLSNLSIEEDSFRSYQAEKAKAIYDRFGMTETFAFFFSQRCFMKRIEVFIDGFNLYFGMKDCNATHSYRKILWLDISSFLHKYLDNELYRIANIYYFTAIPENNKKKAERHQLYCKALESTGIKIIYGQYKDKFVNCPLCKQEFKSYEEKETDVNVALWILRRGIEDGYDKAVLFSGDSDLAPALENAQELFKDKIFQVMFPINRNRSNRLKKVCPVAPMYQYQSCYKKNQFPDIINLPDGTTLTKPERWK